MQIQRNVMSLICLGLMAAAVFASPVVAQEVERDEPEGLQFGGLTGPDSLGFYRSNHWGLAEVSVDNPTDREQEARAILIFDGQPDRQFIRRLWLPPQVRRRAVVPARFRGVGAEQPSVDVEAILTPPDAEVQLDRTTGIASIRHDRHTFAMIAGGDRGSGEATGVMTAVRELAGLSRAMAYVPSEQAPRFHVGWDGVTAAAIVTDNPTFDSAQRESLRSWLESGGTLVVFADRVPGEAMGQLLGEMWNISVVDHVSLTSLHFQEDMGGGSPVASGSEEREQEGDLPAVEVEEPIEMARLIAPPEFETLLEVRGWPALLSRPVGNGRLVVVAVGGRAWTHPDGRDALAELTGLVAPRNATLAGQSLRPTEMLRGDAGQEFVAGQIGYQIVSRPIVAGVLGLFLMVLIVAAAAWWRGGRLERIGPVGAVAALLAMGLLLAMGQRERSQIPPTRASLQMVTVEPGQRTAQMAGVMGLFDGEGGEVTLQGQRGGMAWPISVKQTGQLARMVTADLDDWRWVGLPMPAGAIQPLDFTAAVTLDQPLMMDLRYGPEGLSGTVDWPVEGGGEDPLMVTPRANLRVEAVPDGGATRLTIRPDGILPAGVLSSSGGLIGQVQQDRAAVTRRVLEEDPFGSPTLLAWSPGLDAGFDLEVSMDRKDQALWAVPLRLERTEPGNQVRIPWPLLPMRPDRDMGQDLKLKMLPIYRPDGGWIDQVTGSSAFVARFSLPRQVLPLEIEEAVVHLDITAIGRPVRILAIRDGEAEVVATLDAPDGHQTVTIPGDLLQPDGNGDVFVAFDVGDTADRSGEIQTSQMWGVRQFGLEVAGTVLEPSEPATPNP